jgi:hypothetical protein
MEKRFMKSRDLTLTDEEVSYADLALSSFSSDLEGRNGDCPGIMLVIARLRTKMRKAPKYYPVEILA